MINNIFQLDPKKHLFPIREWCESKENSFNTTFESIELAYVGLRCKAVLFFLSVAICNNYKDHESAQQSQILLKASQDFIQSYTCVFLDIKKLSNERIDRIIQTLDSMYLNIYTKEEEIYQSNLNILKTDCEFCLEIRNIFSTYAFRFFDKD